MFIVEMTTYESDFVIKNTKRSGAYDIRTFDIDHEMSLFVYYYEEYIALKLRRYGNRPTTVSDWERLKHIKLIQPDLYLNDVADVFVDHDDNQVHVKIRHTISKRTDT